MNATKYNSINAHFYEVVMYMQRLHHFCIIDTPDDDTRLGWKDLGNKLLWKVY